MDILIWNCSIRKFIHTSREFESPKDFRARLKASVSLSGGSSAVPYPYTAVFEPYRTVRLVWCPEPEDASKEQGLEPLTEETQVFDGLTLTSVPPPHHPGPLARNRFQTRDCCKQTRMTPIRPDVVKPALASTSKALAPGFPARESLSFMQTSRLSILPVRPVVLSLAVVGKSGMIAKFRGILLMTTLVAHCEARISVCPIKIYPVEVYKTPRSELSSDSILKRLHQRTQSTAIQRPTREALEPCTLLSVIMVAQSTLKSHAEEVDFDEVFGKHRASRCNNAIKYMPSSCDALSL
ncbi:hypothetical protein R3P38DRAFT_2761272 [Favolaschia claudopus]|uniref:Uncharacterized protein n=1 Tax=Favolaschia claudopus TaxID=2862362 RepID=A0AAW0DZC6_9AGAR